jgi:protein tyrosine phosphatase (PTP) superfamily phosphohydrolase (DUF442 family)
MRQRTPRPERRPDLMTLTLSPPELEDAPEASIEPIDGSGPGAAPGQRRWRRCLLRAAVGFAAFLALGNLGILAAHGLARAIAPAPTVDVPPEVAAIRNFEAIDAKLWRGGAPDDAAYRALAGAGVTTVIDLRAERDRHVPHALLGDLGLELVAIPVRDGQAPTTGEVSLFLDAVAQSPGAVYLHCGAGVGRTGTMAAAYRVALGDRGVAAMRANLAVGPPSLEQLAFAASLEPGEPAQRPNAALVAVSRTLDAPRRIWKVVEGT